MTEQGPLKARLLARCTGDPVDSTPGRDRREGPFFSSSESTLVHIRQSLSRLHVHSTLLVRIVGHVKDPVSTFRRPNDRWWHGNTQMTRDRSEIIRTRIVATPVGRRTGQWCPRF